MHSTTSSYPLDVDARRFFSDVRIKHTNIRDAYNELIRNQQYQSASRYLYDNVEVQDVDMDYNGAYLWNRIENQIPPIEQKCYNLEMTKVRPHYYPYPPTEKYVKETVWIS